MVPLTRRTLLSGAVGLTAALAGCSGLRDGSGGSTSTAPRDDGPDGPTSGSATDPETLLVRTDADRPPVWLGNADGRPTASRQTHWRNHVVVDGDARAERVSVADSVDRDRVESFLDATEFDTETVYVELARVEACFEHELCRIGWSASEISTDYARRTRPYSAHCEVDASRLEARFIRIPAAIDADEVNSYSSSVGSGGCDPRHGGAAGDSADARSTTESTDRTETATTASETETPVTASETETPTTDSSGDQ